MAVIDQELHRLLLNLADAIRDVPEGLEYDSLTKRFSALLFHVQSKGVIPLGHWVLESRKPRREGD